MAEMKRTLISFIHLCLNSLQLDTWFWDNYWTGNSRPTYTAGKMLLNLIRPFSTLFDPPWNYYNISFEDPAEENEATVFKILFFLEDISPNADVNYT